MIRASKFPQIAATLAALLLLGTSAQAYTLFSDRGLNNGRWQGPAPTITYLWNEVGSADILAEGNTLAQYEQVIVDAFDRYTNITDSDLTYVNGGSTTAGFSIGDGSNVVTTIDTGWPFSSTTSGLAQTSFLLNGFSVETDIIMNGEDRDWTIVGTQGSDDFTSTLTHEIGHMSGLDHSPLRAATMYPTGSSIGTSGDAHTRRTTLSSDDIQGITVLYGTGSGTGSISGTITSDVLGQGIPVGAIDVLTGQTYMAITGGLAGQPNQNYTIQHLPPADYKLFIIPTNSTPVGGGFTSLNFTSAMSNIDTVFQPRFYDNGDTTGTAVFANADNVTVTSGGSVTGISINPPSTAGSKQLYYYSNASGSSSTTGALHQNTESLFYAVENTTASCLAVGLTLGFGTPTGAFFSGIGVGGANVNIFRQTFTSTASQAETLFTPYIPHSSGEVDFDPGAIEHVVYPTVEYSGAAIVSTLPIDFSVTFNESVLGLSAADFVIGGTSGATVADAISFGGGSSYTLRFNTVPGPGTIVVGLAPEKVTNSAGFPNIGSTSLINVVTYDATAPVYTTDLTLTSTTPTNTLPATFTLTFDEPVLNFTEADITVNQGSTTGTPTVTLTGTGAGPYTVEVTGLTGSGTVTLQVLGAGINDAAGNVPLDSGIASFDLDTVAPGYSPNLTLTSTSPTNTLPATFSVRFTETILGFTDADVQVNQGTLTGTPVVSVTGGPINFSIQVSGLTGVGTFTTQILGAGLSDAAGNFPVDSATVSVDLDTVSPGYTANLTRTSVSPTNVLPASFSVEFDEPVFGFTNANVSVNQGTTVGIPVVVVTGTGPYTIDVSGLSGDGTISVQIIGAGISDAAGNAAIDSAVAIVVLDTTRPGFSTFDLSTGQANPTNVDSFSFEITFSEPIDEATFTAADLNFAGSSVGGTLGAIITGTGAGPYTIVVSGATSDGDVLTAVRMIGINDLAGNNGLTPTPTRSITYDSTAPSLNTFALGGSQPNPTNVDSFTYTIDFSEPIDSATFTAADLVFTGTTVTGTLTPVIFGSGSGPYTITLTGATSDGDVVLGVDLAGIADFAGNAATGTAAGQTITYDTTIPTVGSYVLASGQLTPTNINSFSFDVTFDAPILAASFTGADVITSLSTVGGPLSVTVSGTGAGPYTINVSGATTDGSVVASIDLSGILDLAGNSGVGTTADLTIVYDTTAPTIFAYGLSGGQTDPAVTLPISFEVTFAEPIDPASFVASDLDFTGTTAGGTPNVVSITGTGAGPYTILVNGFTSTGTVTCALDAANIADLAGNAGTGISSQSLQYNQSSFGVSTFALAAAQNNPTNVDSFTFEITFDSAINSATFTDADLDFTGTTAAGTLTALITGAGAGPYTVAVSGATGSGIVSVAVNLTGIEDLATNPGTITTPPLTVTYDITSLGVSTFALAALQPNPTNVDSFSFVITFDEPINPASFDASDLDFSTSTVSGTLTPIISGSGAGPYTITLTGATSDGDVILSIDTIGLQDVAGNSGATVTGIIDVTYDTTPFTVTLFDDASGQPNPTNVDLFEVEITFNEAINPATFTAADLVFTSSTAGGTFVPVITGIGAGPYAISITGATSDGDVVVSVDLTGIQDVAGNAGVGSTADIALTYDTTAPFIIDFIAAATQPEPTNLLPIQFEVTFNEPINPTTLDLTDFNFTGTSAPGTPSVIGISGTGAGPYTVTVDGLTGTGTLIINLDAPGVQDIATNAGVGTDSANVYYDIDAPTVSAYIIAAAQPNPTNVDSFTYEITFNEPINAATFTDADVITTTSTVGGTLITTVTGSGAGPYTINITGAAIDGNVIASVDLSGIQDNAGNAGVGSSGDLSIAYDITGPTITALDLAAAQVNPTNTLPLTFEVTFDEAINGATLVDSDFTFTGTTAAGTPAVSSIVGGGAGPYTITVNGLTGSGLVVINLDAAALTDALGNSGTGTDSASLTFDVTGPSVIALAKTAAQPDPTNVLPIAFEVTFDQAINPATFTAADIDFSGTTAAGTPVASNFVGSGVGPYTFDVSGLTGTGDVTVSVLATTVADVLGNVGAANSGSATVFYNISAAAVSSFTLAGGQPNPAPGLPVEFSVTFSQPINPATFTSADVTLAGSTAIGTYSPSIISGTGAGPYIIQVGGTLTIDGTINAQVLGAGIQDLFANPVTNNSGTVSVTIDRVRPVITTFQLNPTPGIYTGTQPIVIRVDFNKAINPATFEDVDVSVVLGTATGATSVTVTPGVGTGPHFISVSGLLTPGTLTISMNAAGVEDLIGNAGLGTSGLSLTYDPTPPTLLSITPAFGQPNPAAVLPITFTVMFSEVVIGFTGFDCNFAGTTALGTPTVSSIMSLGNGLYDVTVTGFTGSGDVVLGINMPGVRDLAGNTGTLSTLTATVTYSIPSAVPDWEQSKY